MPVQLARRSFTVDEYHQMAHAGIFTEDDRVELIEGEIVEMSPIGIRQAVCVRRLNRLFSTLVGDRAIVDVQNPIHLGMHSEPQPDVVLLRPRADLYAVSHPGSADVFLVVEVAETSVEMDREVKVPLYARAGVPEVWLIDLAGEGIEVYRNPMAQGYQEVRRLGRGEILIPHALRDLQLGVDDILGSALTPPGSI